MLLALNEGHAIHSIYNPNELLTGGPWDYFMVAPLFNEDFTPESVDRSLMIGLAGGTAARQLLAAYPASTVDGVEIDPVIIELGREYFAMNGSRIDAHVADGRYFLRTSDARFDLVGVDAYRQPYIPFQLTTKEFFTEVRDHLDECGVAVVNVGRTESDFRLVDVLSSTMGAVFADVYVIDVARFSNSMVIGTTCPSSVKAFARNVASAPVDSPLREVGTASLESGNIRSDAPGGRVFTDDQAPVELVVDEIIVDAAREEQDDS